MYKKLPVQSRCKSQWHKSRSKRLEKKIAFKNLHILTTKKNMNPRNNILQLVVHIVISLSQTKDGG